MRAGPVDRTAVGAAEGIDLQGRLGEPELGEEMAEHGQHLGVDRGARDAGDLGADLVELAVAPLLRPLVAEHRPHVVELGDRVGGIQLVLDEGPHDAGGPLRPHGDGVLPLVDERIHLLFDDVGRIADGAAEQLGLLQDRDPDLGKAVQLENPAGGRLDMLPFLHLAGKYVVETLDAGYCHNSTSPYEFKTARSTDRLFPIRKAESRTRSSGSERDFRACRYDRPYSCR